MDHPAPARPAAPRPEPGADWSPPADPGPAAVPPPAPADAGQWTLLGGSTSTLRSDSLWEMALKGHGDVPLLAQPSLSPVAAEKHRGKRPPAWSVVGIVVLVLCFMGAVLVLGEGGSPRRTTTQVVSPVVGGPARPDPRATAAAAGRDPGTTTTTAPVPGGAIPGLAASPAAACSATLTPAAGNTAVLDVAGVPPDAPVTVKLGRGASASSTTTVAGTSGVATATLDLGSLRTGQPAVVTVYAAGASCQTVFTTTPPVTIPATTTTAPESTTTTAPESTTTTAPKSTTTTAPKSTTTTAPESTTTTAAAAPHRAGQR